MLVKNFKAIIDSFDKAGDVLKDRTREAITEAQKDKEKTLNVDEAINVEMRRLRSYVLDAVVADEAENEAKK